MNTTKSWIIGVLTLSLVVFVSGGKATGGTTARGEPSWYWGVAPEETVKFHQGLSGTQVGRNLHRAADLTGSTIRNRDGKKLGTVYDLVLTPDLNGVSYAAVSTGGFFGMGRRLHAIPWSAVQTGPDGKIVAAISEEEFARDPGFAVWPAEGNPRWLDRTGERAGRAGLGVVTAADRYRIENRRFSRIKGMEVRGREDRRIGTVRDLVVATDTGAVPYTIVSLGGFLGLGQQYAAVPRNAVDWEMEQRTARVNVDRQVLQGYAFSPGAFPNLSDPLYAQRLDRAYGVEGGQTALGYVPGKEK